MKRLLLLAALMGTMLTQTGQVRQRTGVTSDNVVKEKLTPQVRAARKARSTACMPSKATRAGEDVDVTVRVDIDDDGWDDFANLIAFRLDTQGKPEVYKADLGPTHRLFEDGTFTFTLPAGTYDILACGHTEREEPFRDGFYMIIKEGVKIGEVTELSYNVEEAAKRVTFVQCGPDGKEIDIPKGGTGECYTMIDWKGFNIYRDHCGKNEASNFQDIFINEIPQNFTFTRLDLGTTTKGILTFVAPVDFTTDTIKAGTANWQSAQMNFADCPLYTRFKEWEKSKTSKTSAIVWSIIMDDDRLDLRGNLLTNPELPTNIIYSWVPEGYGNHFEYMVYPEGDAIAADFSAGFYGLGFRRSATGDKLSQIGRNFKNQRLMGNVFAYGDNYLLTPSNPRYSGVMPTATLANCVPATILLPMPSGVWEYDFFGRHGEDMVLDACDLATVTRKNKFYTDVMGSRSPSDIKIWINDSLMCDTREAFAKFKFGEGKYKVELGTANVLIDGTIPGSNSTVMEFDGGREKLRPTLTALQMRDKNDSVTDRFEHADGYVEFFCGAFTAHSNQELRINYCSVSELKDVELSYSPAGKDQWYPILTEEVPELFFMPGYGYCFRGPLSAVNVASDNKWYDLRVRITAADGSYQQQTIAPAFRIETADGSGIESIGSDNTTTMPADIYNLSGTVIARGVSSGSVWTLQPGIYIVRQGERVRKVAVK